MPAGRNSFAAGRNAARSTDITDLVNLPLAFRKYHDRKGQHDLMTEVAYELAFALKHDQEAMAQLKSCTDPVRQFLQRQDASTTELLLKQFTNSDPKPLGVAMRKMFVKAALVTSRKTNKVSELIHMLPEEEDLTHVLMVRNPYSFVSIEPACRQQGCSCCAAA